MNFIIIILNNLLGYDGLILILAGVNFFMILPRLKSYSKKLSFELNPTLYLPIAQLLKKISPQDKNINLHYLQALREKELFYYQVYVSITSIFPLMGILGTVISLLSLIDFQTQRLMLSFSTALTSTFWGLIFAITFKAIDSNISSQITFNQENFNLLFRRIDDHLEKEEKGLSPLALNPEIQPKEGRLWRKLI